MSHNKKAGIVPKLHAVILWYKGLVRIFMPLLCTCPYLAINLNFIASREPLKVLDYAFLTVARTYHFDLGLNGM